MKHLLGITLIFLLLSCNTLSPSEKKQIKETGKEIAKQVKATAEHFAADHSYIGFEATEGKKIKMYWKDGAGNLLNSLGNLKKYVEQSGVSLVYACNAGMYMEDRAPLGYFVENGITKQKLNTKNGTGNFYLKPKAVFYITKDGKSAIQEIESTSGRSALLKSKINFASQSGPMLIQNGIINKLFTEGSSNVNIRNGVGILPNGNAYFAMSTYPVNFYDFAKHFKDKGCKSAMYFDGFVSRSFCPSLGYEQLDGNFGVMIGVVK